jgi:hypothetical protein
LVPIWRLGDPFLGYAYLVAGLMLDCGYWAAGRWRDSVWVLALLGGLAHASKPFLRIVITQLSGWPYESLLTGVAYPASTHFLFGAVGAFLGGSLVLARRRRTSQRRIARQG